MRSKFHLFLVVTCLCASLITVVSQFDYIYTHYGQNYIKHEDYFRHQAKVDGTAAAPYRYRILSDHILEFILRLIPFEDSVHQSRRYELTAFGFRLVQNFLIFLLAFWYFRTLGNSVADSASGILLLSFSMCFAFFQSDLSFYTYSQLAFFLLAGLLINTNHDELVPPITVLAALNREEAIFIPIMLMATRMNQLEWRSVFSLKFFSLRFVQQCILSFFGFLLVFFGSRIILGSAEYSVSRYGEIYPGFNLLKQNILNIRTWTGLMQLYGLLPLTLIFIRSWPMTLRYYLYFITIPWFVAQFFFGSTDEARLFLVPLAIVFIPATIKLVSISQNRQWTGCPPK